MGNLVMVTKGLTYASSITQFDVTWNFSTSRPVGQFANDDWWVQGPVVITSITPDYSSGLNGWEVNPLVQVDQGFDNRGSGFDEELMPDFPYTADSAQSIVKVISNNPEGDTLIKTAAVLTVLMDIPSGNGNGYFRPPYIGTSKPLYAVADLQTDLLPSLSSVDDTPSLASIVTTFSKCLRMDHHSSVPRHFRPTDTMNDYQPSNTPDINEALLRLMLNDSLEDKMPALILVTQHALDRAYAVLGGYRRADDGHNPNHRVLAGFAGIMLEITAVTDLLATDIVMHEERYIRKPDSVVLWGEWSGTTVEQQNTFYWNYIMYADGSRSQADPYGYIDGGKLSSVGASYQNIVSQSLKGSALCGILMPELQASWSSTFWPYLRDYADRWVTTGVWAIPDPAAPYDDDPENYGVTFGPQSEDPSLPIEGDGRSTAYHGENTDGGQYKSTFVANMWTTHRS